MASLKILVVDDEIGIRSGVIRILQNFEVDYPFIDEKFNFELLEAASGEEAIKIIDEQKPDIILLDNKLPGIQGIEVLEYIKKHLYDIFVVMITSYASLEVAVKATRDGAYDFIPKPFTPQELRSSIENITKQIFLKRMAQKLNKAGKEIRFQFLSVLSHELKAPINAIEGYLKIMKDKQFGDNIDNYIQIIDRSLERIKGMKTLILDLLDFTKIETGMPKQNIQEIDLIKIAEISIDTVRPYAIQKDVDIYLNNKHPVIIKADPGEMEIIFNNLLSNAVKYNKDKGRVDIYIRKENNYCVIKVDDTGIGISQEDCKKLFTDFFRIKNEQTRHITGSGLGLSIVKKIVDMYQGKIEVKSIYGEGSSFIIFLPL